MLCSRTLLRSTVLWLFPLGIVFCGFQRLHAQDTDRAVELLHTFYEVSGGKHWQQIAEVKVSGKLRYFGATGVFHQLLDLKRGRDVQWFEAGPLKMKQASLETSTWSLDRNGISAVQDGPETRSDASMQSFMDRNGWFHPETAEPHFVGEREEQARHFQIVTLLPSGGRTMTIWLDKETHLLDRVVSEDLAHHDNITTFSDYRKVGEVLYPYRTRQTSDDGKEEVLQVASSVRFVPKVSETAFSVPRSKITDAFLLGSRTRAVVPFEIEQGRILIDVAINGYMPLPFLLDTGALNYLTPAGLHSLGLAGTGSIPLNGSGEQAESAQLATIDSVRLGEVEMRRQQFTIGDLPAFLNQGRETPIAGLLGVELLSRFAVTINYDKKQLIFYRPGTSPLRSSDWQKLPLRFDGNNALLEGSADGNSGEFVVDTGSNSYTTIFSTFYRTHKLAIEVPVLKQMQGGVGGKTTSVATRIRSLEFGPHKFNQVLININFAQKDGFSSALSAGNIGYKLLKNFIITLDYRNRLIGLQPSRDFGVPLDYNRSGMELDETHDEGAVIDQVTPNTPAAALGLAIGDVVLSINGQTKRVSDLLSQPAGTQLTINYKHDGREQKVILTLRELLPPYGHFDSVAPVQ